LTAKATAIIFVGGWGASEPEQALRRAHQAAALDLLEALSETGLVGRSVIATDGPWMGVPCDSSIEIDQDDSASPFHFGERLAGLIERYGAECVLYAGGGSAPLLGPEQWRSVLQRLLAAEHLVVANNLHSCDWVGFTPAAAVVARIAALAGDNGLAWTLAHDGGISAEDMPASAATRFDIDTPSDLLIARQHSGIGARLRRFVDGLDWDDSQVRGVTRAMQKEGGTLAVIGRTCATAWSFVEKSTRCWVRVLAEERGMRASGREKQGQVASLVADYLDLVGVEGFFGRLSELVEGMMMDSRVVFAARGLRPSTSDRFNSDLHRWQAVEEPFLKQFTRAAASAGVPVLLGGQSLVSGGLMALVESLERGV